MIFPGYLWQKAVLALTGWLGLSLGSKCLTRLLRGFLFFTSQFGRGEEPDATLLVFFFKKKTPLAAKYPPSNPPALP
jgi:hypothetical protein